MDLDFDDCLPNVSKRTWRGVLPSKSFEFTSAPFLINVFIKKLCLA